MKGNEILPPPILLHIAVYHSVIRLIIHLLNLFKKDAISRTPFRKFNSNIQTPASGNHSPPKKKICFELRP